LTVQQMFVARSVRIAKPPKRVAITYSRRADRHRSAG
jgi:hypothetical protein